MPFLQSCWRPPSTYSTSNESNSLQLNSRITITRGSYLFPRPSGRLVRRHFHPSKNLGQLDATAIYTTFYGAFRDPEQVDDLLIDQFFNVSQDHALAQVRRKLIDGRQNL